MTNSIGWFFETAMSAYAIRRNRRAYSIFPVLAEIRPWRMPALTDCSRTRTRLC